MCLQGVAVLQICLVLFRARALSKASGWHMEQALHYALSKLPEPTVTQPGLRLSPDNNFLGVGQDIRAFNDDDF